MLKALESWVQSMLIFCAMLNWKLTVFGAVIEFVVWDGFEDMHSWSRSSTCQFVCDNLHSHFHPPDKSLLFCSIRPLRWFVAIVTLGNCNEHGSKKGFRVDGGVTARSDSLPQRWQTSAKNQHWNLSIMACNLVQTVKRAEWPHVPSKFLALSSRTCSVVFCDCQLTPRNLFLPHCDLTVFLHSLSQKWHFSFFCIFSKSQRKEFLPQGASSCEQISSWHLMTWPTLSSWSWCSISMHRRIREQWWTLPTGSLLWSHCHLQTSMTKKKKCWKLSFQPFQIQIGRMAKGQDGKQMNQHLR